MANVPVRIRARDQQTPNATTAQQKEYHPG
jgi:hypothetical protein